jgi:hypothetical protein
MLKNFIFIDSRVVDCQTLVTELVRRSEWHLVAANEDDVAQMVWALSGRSGLDSVQIVSHGSSGNVLLGVPIGYREVRA